MPRRRGSRVPRAPPPANPNRGVLPPLLLAGTVAALAALVAVVVHFAHEPRLRLAPLADAPEDEPRPLLFPGAASDLLITPEDFVAHAPALDDVKASSSRVFRSYDQSARLHGAEGLDRGYSWVDNVPAASVFQPEPGRYHYLFATAKKLGRWFDRRLHPLMERAEKLAGGVGGGGGSSKAGDRFLAPKLFVSSANVTAPAHYDALVNVYAQLHGDKTFTLLPPESHRKLYLYSYLHPSRESSQIQDLSPPAAAFPSFRRANAYTVTLHPGDVLVIPPMWFHEVVCMSEACISAYTPRPFTIPTRAKLLEMMDLPFPKLGLEPQAYLVALRHFVVELVDRIGDPERETHGNAGALLLSEMHAQRHLFAQGASFATPADAQTTEVVELLEKTCERLEHSWRLQGVAGLEEMFKAGADVRAVALEAGIQRAVGALLDATAPVQGERSRQAVRELITLDVVEELLVYSLGSAHAAFEFTRTCLQ